MPLKKEFHCVHNSHYHIVFSVKYRKVLLDNKVTFQIREISKGIEERYELDIEQLGCDLDHIHLLCSFHPKYSGGEVVRLFKSITARELFKRLPDLRKELWGGEFWSDGYYLATVGEGGNWEVVEKYVRNQGKNPQEVQLRLL